MHVLICRGGMFTFDFDSLYPYDSFNILSTLMSRYGTHLSLSSGRSYSIYRNRPALPLRPCKSYAALVVEPQGTARYLRAERISIVIGIVSTYDIYRKALRTIERRSTITRTRDPDVKKSVEDVSTRGVNRLERLCE